MSDPELMHVSEPVRRFEVFTGSGRRRSWTAEEKARIVAESYGSGDTVCGVARRHGLTPQQLFTWRRKARKQAEAGLSFAPVIVADAAQIPSFPNPEAMIEVAIGGAIIRVPAGADGRTLEIILRTMKGLR